MGGSYLINKNTINSVNMLNKYGVNFEIGVVPTRSILDSGDLINTLN
jgi:hypothetical protein